MSRHSHPALGDLVDLRKILISQARRLGIFEHDVDDLVQETFMRIFRATAIDVNGNPRGYAITTLRRLRMDHIRNWTRRKAALALYHPAGYTPPVEIARLEAQDTIRVAGDVLSPREFTDLKLATLGYDSDERAEMVPWSNKHVASTRTGQSRRKLEAALAA